MYPYLIYYIPREKSSERCVNERMNFVAFTSFMGYTEVYSRRRVNRRMEKSRKQAVGIVLIMVFMIVLTRGLTVTHNMELHGDEHVFFTAAQSLKGYISGSSPVYEEVKEYPEGAIVLQLPFHILTAIINRLTAANISPRLSGRIAAVFYFTVGAVLGCVVFHRFFSKKPFPLAVYAAVVVFSLIHIEQSRYGTGDAISFALLMAVIFLTASALTAEKHTFLRLLSAFFVCGVLCAVKYPLIYFSVIPIFGCIALLHGQHGGRKAAVITAAVVLVYLGFAAVSPKAAFHSSYIIRASTRELGAYLGTGISRLTLLWINLMCVTTYSMLYSGLPLMPVFFVLGARRAWKESSAAPVELLFGRILPVIIAVFFAYNLTASFLAMRSFYPFFFLTDLYAAAYIGSWLESVGAKRAAAYALTGIMVLRGAYLICLMTDNSDSARMADMIDRAVSDDWNTTTVLSGQLIFPDNYQQHINQHVIDIRDERFSSPDTMRLHRGELFIAGARDHSISSFQFAFVPFDSISGADEYAWVEFSEVNEEYCVGRLYPEYYYYLFGYWLRGTTGTGAEFPTCTIYYRG